MPSSTLVRGRIGEQGRTRSRRNDVAESHAPYHDGVQQLQRTLGNRALLEVLQAQAHRARLDVSQGHDADEKAADAAAAQVMRGPAPESGAAGARCGCGTALAVPGTCDKCRVAARVLQCRSSGNAAGDVSAAPPLVHRVLDRPGQALDASTRTFFEPRFGADLGHVRVHTDTHAARSADAVGALAYTVGHQLVFGDGQYAPATQHGRELIAHELAHVLQQGAGRRRLRRRPRTDLLHVSISPAEAQALSDADLDSSMLLLREQIASTSRDSPDLAGAQQNLWTLEAESDRRKKPAPVQASDPAQERASKHEAPVSQPQTVPRPSGLPLDRGFQLVPADAVLSPAVKQQIREGELTTLPATALGAVGVGSGMNTAANSILSVTGFASAGENSIGLVGMPSYSLMRGLKGVGPLVPESFSTLGHTAAYVRVGNQIVAVRGFTPKLLELLAKYQSTVAGKTGVAGSVGNDAWLFSKMSAQSVEWSVPPEMAQQFLQEMDAVGDLSRVKWTGVPAGCQGTNCVLYAVEQVEGKLGGRVAVPTGEGPVPITDLGSGGTTAPRTAAQGKFIEVLKGAESGSQELAPIEGALGSAVVGSLGTAPRYIQVLKVGGRVFFVIGAVATVAEVAMAPEGEGTRTAVGAGAGFVGGLAFGAAAGLVCGPGAPVCSVVLGLGFGVAGAFASRAAAEGIYDVATGRARPSSNPNSSQWMYPGACFTGDTPIRMANGGSKRIDSIRPGDRVLAFDEQAPEDGPARLRGCEVTATFAHAPDSVCEVVLTGAGVLRVTPNHLLLVNGTWRPAQALRVGDELLSIDDACRVAPRRVASVELQPALDTVHDITVADCHTYFAGNVLAHNKGP